MTRLAALFALPALFLAAPASALSLTAAQLGDIYCYARLSGDMAPVLAILTPELSALVAEHLPPGADAATAIPWQSSADYANTCMPVGSSGTSDAPEIVIAFGYRDPDKPGYADRLVLRFVDQRIRIDDIAYGASGTLRQKLTASP
ncbi:MAG: hypothetical protein HY834_17590 [Devosia nanyangense]|uniref:Uncharacterized protein n=1 Tax=Devosia nanyangense TaxID=1228055 RepID=A0A933NZY4_9HYPH|nr:hypothetical protein [Devosia nanyangense]